MRDHIFHARYCICSINSPLMETTSFVRLFFVVVVIFKGGFSSFLLFELF